MALPLPDDSSRRSMKKRPESVERLGLQLPVTEGDVKQAYRMKAQEAHPDHGGEVSDFLEVQRAFDEAVEFAKRNGKRLPWIGAQMPVYVAQRDAIALVEELGGKFVVESLDWLEGTVGSDFAQMADRLTSIDLSGSAAGDADLASLLSDAPHLPFLESLNLSGTRVTDTSAVRLARLPSLKTLDLRGTQVTYGLRKQLAKQPGMVRVEGASRWAALFGRG